MNKQIGQERIFLFSMIVVFIVFSCAYIAMNIFYHGPLSDHLFPVFLLMLLLTYPLHKLLHFIPIVRHRKRLRYSINKKFGFIPILNMKIHEPIIKSHYIASLLIPFILINMVFVIGAIYYPIYHHYFIILLAYHCGLCLIDLIYIKLLLKAPKKSLIEENDKGFQILIPHIKNHTDLSA